MEGENRKQQKHGEGCSGLQGISLTPPRRGPVSHGHSQLSAGNGESHAHPSAPQRAWEARCTHPGLANAPQRSWERGVVLLGRCFPALHLEVAVGTQPSWMPPPARSGLKPSRCDLWLAATTWKPPNPSPHTDFSPKRGRKTLGGGGSQLQHPDPHGTGVLPRQPEPPRSPRLPLLRAESPARPGEGGLRGEECWGPGEDGAALPVEAIRYSTLHLFPAGLGCSAGLEDGRLFSDVTRKQLQN